MTNRVIIRPDDLQECDSVPRVIRHLTEEILAAESAGHSQLAESLLMDLNIIMELAWGGDVDKVIANLNNTAALRDEVLDIRDQIAEATQQGEIAKAATLRTRLWELLDAAWKERKRLKPVGHEHVSSAEIEKQQK
jgi:hypothetical protein